VKIQKLQIAIILVATVLAVQAQAQVYLLSFTGSVSAANGQIDVVGGVATSGYLDVTLGDNQGTYNLVSLTSPLITGGTPSVPSVRFTDGTDETLDNLVNVSSNPFLTDNGLVFANDHTIGFNLWGNGPGSYTLFDVSGSPIPHVYLADNGTAILVQVPEASVTTMFAFFMGLSLLMVTVRKKSSVVS
jgi:hypothetical protein